MEFEEDPREAKEFRTEIELTLPLKDDLEVVLSGRLRFGDSFEFRERVGGVLNFKPNKYLTFSGGYRYQGEREFRSKPELEHRFLGGVQLNLPLSEKWSASNRHLFERRYELGDEPNNRYRIRGHLERKIKINRHNYSAFFTNESYYEITFSRWMRNSSYIGFSRDFNEKFGGKLYYLRQQDGTTRPGDLNVIGTEFSFSL